MRSELLEPCGVIRVQTWDLRAAFPPAVEQVLGAGWPTETGAMAIGGSQVICNGPAEWLVVTADGATAGAVKGLEEAFENSPFRATNVSRSLVRIGIDGEAVRELLAKGCSLDLDSSRFVPGRSARARFAGMPMVVCCMGSSRFECIVAVSYATYTLSWLADAALEFGA
jgi:sarcosine oxidase, subunit gamma